MKIQVIRELLCQKAEPNKEKGTIDCQGIAEMVPVSRFPAVVTFQWVLWMQGVTEETNNFEAAIWNPAGELIARNEHIQIAYFSERFSSQGVPLVFCLNNGTFQGPEDHYIIEMKHQKEVLFRKNISAVLEPRIIPNTERGDQGTVRLDREC